MRVEDDFDPTNLTPYYTRKCNEAKIQVERLSHMKAEEFTSEEVIVGCCPRSFQTYDEALSYWQEEVERFHSALTEPTVLQLSEVRGIMRRLKRKLEEVEQELTEVLTQLEKIDPVEEVIDSHE